MHALSLAFWRLHHCGATAAAAADRLIDEAIARHRCRARRVVSCRTRQSIDDLILWRKEKRFNHHHVMMQVRRSLSASGPGNIYILLNTALPVGS